jgi:hypothetical protein
MTHGPGATTGAGGLEFLRQIGYNVAGFYMTDSQASAREKYSEPHVFARTMPVAVTVVLELESGFLPHYIDKGEWPKGASDGQKLSGVKPNHQQMHTAGDVHISNVILATHLKSEITNKDHLQTFDLWTRRMDKVNLTSLILRYTKLEHPIELSMLFGLPHDTKRLWKKEDLIAEMDADPKQVAHWNQIMSHTFAIKEPGFAEYNPITQ